LICVSLKVKSLEEHTALHGNPTSELADVTVPTYLPRVARSERAPP